MSHNANFKDLSNQTFGYLTALYVDTNKSTTHHTYWVCRCICGRTRSLQTHQLTTQKVTSCGCQNMRTKLHNKVESQRRLYSLYNSMIARCHNPNSTSYKYYGNKGISVCEEWRNDFGTFSEWAERNGYSDSLSIDRIDNSKGYFPDNCRWIPLKEQSENKTTSIKYTHNGETHNLKEWCEILNFSYVLAKSRRKDAKRKNIVPTFEYVFAPPKFHRVKTELKPS